MLKINNHINAIIERSVAPCDRDYQLTWADNAAIVEVTIAATTEHHGVKRYVTITKENDAREYEIKFQEIANNPTFTTRQEACKLKAGDPNDLARACREVYAHIRGKVKTKLIPSVEMVERWQHINDTWLTGDDCHLELFLQGGEFGDDWRFRIVHVGGTVICESLDPDTADGHTYRQLINSAKEAFKRGLLEGQVRAGEAFAQNAFNAVFANDGRRFWSFPEGVRQLMEHGTIRPTKTTI